MSRSDDQRPNILFICTDQQHHRMMSCAGNEYLQTPNMDRIAAAGTRFDRSYCTNPVCCPSRFSLFTGRMPSAIGMTGNNGKQAAALTDDERQQSLGHLLRGAGYETAYGGKVHVPKMNAVDLGWDYFCKDERDRLAIEAADFIRSDHDRPWACVASFINPHDICHHAIRAYAQTDFDHAIIRNCTDAIAELDEALQLPEGVDDETFFRDYCPPLPPNYDIQAEEPSAIGAVLDERPFKRDVREHWGEREWRLHRWAYHRLTERVDGQIGVVLDALAASGQWDNTVIIFTSDHGDHDSSHRLEHKTFFYDEAARVPFIISHPGHIDAGRVDDEHLVCNGLDLMATCCDYAGIAKPDFNRGESVRTVAEEPQADWRDDVYGENCCSRMLCTKRWKYVRYAEGTHPEQLYDLEADPWETRNHAAEHPEVLQDLSARLDAHIQDHQGLAVTNLEQSA